MKDANGARECAAAATAAAAPVQVGAQRVIVHIGLVPLAQVLVHARAEQLLAERSIASAHHAPHDVGQL